MSADPTPTSTSAVVRTERPDRYAKQLVSHLGRRVEADWDAQRRAGTVRFPSGRADLRCGDNTLELRIELDEASVTNLAELEDVIGRHLVRFGAKDELVVRWVRDDGSPGSEHRSV